MSQQHFLKTMSGVSSMKPRRRIMRDFVIDEISAVDIPAQRGAMVTIMKQRATQEHQMSFDYYVDQIAKRDSCPRHQAMSKARIEHPAAFEVYQAEGIARVEKARRTEVLPGLHVAQRAFQAKVAEVARNERISRTAAMRRVREEYPDLYDAMQLVGAA